MSEPDLKEQPRTMSTFGKVVLGIIVVVLLGSIGARALMGAGDDPGTASPSTTPGGGSAFLPSQTPGQTGETGQVPAEEGLGGVLPYLTEGSFFALIGFALGYTSKKVVKLGLILLAVTFVVLQGLAFAGVIAIDWDHALDWANRLILNVRENETLSTVVQHRIPSAGAFAGGWVLGLKSG